MIMEKSSLRNTRGMQERGYLPAAPVNTAEEDRDSFRTCYTCFRNQTAVNSFISLVHKTTCFIVDNFLRDSTFFCHLLSVEYCTSREYIAAQMPYKKCDGWQRQLYGVAFTPSLACIFARSFAKEERGKIRAIISII